MNIFQGRGVLKNAIFENNGRRLNQMRYSSMNDRIAPGIWSPFVPTIIPSYHTSQRYLWKIIVIMVCFFTPPPPKDQGGVMKYTPPLKKFNTFDRSYWNHILGIKILAFLTFKWSKRRKSVGSFFRNWHLHYVMSLCSIFSKSSQQNFLLSINFTSGRPIF